ncbi:MULTISPECIES: hypothetical protein [Streptomyces]|uniref:Uncharacterized protein n=1 Tax=Streptomyces cavourensis TaxID=67258 RepID=A0ABY5FAG8_9ACTN|nr:MULTISPECIES: hypothetical protein [Streptomyces]UTR80666.1 hypothetical protein NLU04_20385 [Streptomyces cavourensis]WST13444.1 hypothetical protein OG721_05430 [Streptomyces microflavus]SCK26714.1 hypothetical protein YUYDRAFT_02945 [Streptomyces sp. ScaeMP-e48]
MRPDFERELIPGDDALHLIGALNVMKDKTHNAAHQWELLDEDGHVPASPSYTVLLQHATNAQDLSREVLRLTAEFARSPHHATHAGSAVLTKLAWATTASSHAPPHFAQTAEYALSLLRSTDQADRQYFSNNMVHVHATGRAYLRRASEALRDAAEELGSHLGVQRFLAQLPRHEYPPAPPPPRPGGRPR